MLRKISIFFGNIQEKSYLCNKNRKGYIWQELVLFKKRYF